MNRDLDAALGLTLGALITAIRKTGVSEDEVRQWVDSALRSYSAMQGTGHDGSA